MSKNPEILVVDDEPDVRDALKTFLRNHGYRVMVAKSGEEAVKLLADNTFDLIMLDVVLPGMSGLDVMDYVSDNNLSTLIIVMTGFASTDSAIESFRKRAYDYLIKPFNFPDLMIRVKNALNYKRTEEDRKRAEETLREAHDELEQWVEERTEQLASVNERLRKEINERRETERQIKASLKENELLLRESHHRAKNNLQIISSLLDVTIMGTQNREATELLKASRSQVQAMALLYMQLDTNGQFDLVHMEKFMQDLLPLVHRSYKGAGAEIQTIIEPTDVKLPIEKAVSCALVMNELLSNAFKHAFKGRKQGCVTLSISRAGYDSILMTVKDDGIGMPGDAIKAETLGIKLTNNIVRGRLNGKMKIKHNIGTEVAIEFPLSGEG